MGGKINSCLEYSSILIRMKYCLLRGKKDQSYCHQAGWCHLRIAPDQRLRVAFVAVG